MKQKFSYKAVMMRELFFYWWLCIEVRRDKLSLKKFDEKVKIYSTSGSPYLMGLLAKLRSEHYVSPEARAA